MTRLFILLLAVAVSGCTIGKDYVRPAVDLPQDYRLGSSEAVAIASLHWWQRFNDPTLNSLIDIALRENKDLRIASARIREFYAQYGVSRAELFPQINLDGSYERSSASQTAGFALVERRSTIRDDFFTALGLNWELDIWGRIRRSNEAAFAAVLAEEASRRAVVLTLISSLAQAYIDLRNLDRQLEIARSTLQSREQSYKLANSRFTAGVTSELDLRQAEAEVAAAQVTIPGLEEAIARQENQISVLTGRNPQSIPRGKPIEELYLNSGVPVGLPSTLLEQRPDLIAAEQDLIAANARIAVARAQYFPRLSLTALFGFQSAELSEWLERPSRTWSFGPAATLPIFTAGRLSGQVAVSRAQQEQALINYERAIQTALREVEDALISHTKTAEEKAARTRQVSVLTRYLSLAQTNYDAGQVSYLEVLDAQRNLFNAQIQLTQSQAAYASAQILLFRALGGAWVEESAIGPSNGG